MNAHQSSAYTSFKTTYGYSFKTLPQNYSIGHHSCNTDYTLNMCACLCN